MPTIVWPKNVPACFSWTNYVEEKQPVTVRSPVDSGPQKMRRRYTRPLVGIMSTIVCTKQELADLGMFFDVTLQGGTQHFQMNHQITGFPEMFRFLQPPRFTAMKADTFSVEIVLERI